MFFDKKVSSGKIIIKGCDLADTRFLRVIKNVSILLKDGVIVSVGEFDTSGIDAEVINAQGYTATPGLVDSHVHLCLSGKPDCHLTLDELSPDERMDILTSNLARNLNNGITTVRDLGCRWDMPEQMRSLEQTQYNKQSQKDTPFPTVFFSGPACTKPNGHALFIGESISNTKQLEDFLIRLKDIGADTFKLIGTGGNLSVSTDCTSTQFSDEEFSEIIKAAHSEGFDIACHAHATEGIEQCLNYGVRSIEHGSYMNSEQVQRLTQRGDCYWVPTVCPGRLISNLSEAAADRVKLRRENIRLAAKYNAKIVAGTDAGIGGVLHGSLPYELDEFMDAGMTPLKALKSATFLATELMRLERKTGVIEDEADADILLYSGDIEKPGFSFHNPAVVIKGGSIVKNSLII